MSYVVTLYVEGGEHDGESFVCGPYDTHVEAQRHGDKLASRGQTEVLPLLVDSREVMELL